MKRCIFILIFFGALYSNYCNAQSLQATLNEWSLKNPIEKVYLHTDRRVYFAGQTIWFKSYFISDYKPSQDNSTLFVELLNAQSKVILKKVLPVFNSITYGQVELPDSLSSGFYWLRAYAPLMLNQNKSYLYTSPIKVFGKSKISKSQSSEIVKPFFSISFFPEGGNIIAGVENTVAYKASTPEGYPTPTRTN